MLYEIMRIAQTEYQQRVGKLTNPYVVEGMTYMLPSVRERLLMTLRHLAQSVARRAHIAAPFHKRPAQGMAVAKWVALLSSRHYL